MHISASLGLVEMDDPGNDEHPFLTWGLTLFAGIANKSATLLEKPELVNSLVGTSDHIKMDVVDCLTVLSDDSWFPMSVPSKLPRKQKDAMMTKVSGRQQYVLKPDGERIWY